MEPAAAETTIKDQVSAEEWALRVDLAAAYRLVALY
ncbi:MAG: class II aldolase, partial [Sphingomonas sp.]